MPSNENGASRHLLEPRFGERWVGLAYTFSGTFVLDATGLTPERVRLDFVSLYRATLAHRRRRWPRGMARFFLVPIYGAASFQPATKDFLSGRGRPGRWAVAMKPVLFDSRRNHIEAIDAVQNDTLTCHWYLQTLFDDGIAAAARHFGHLPGRTTNPRALNFL